MRVDVLVIELVDLWGDKGRGGGMGIEVPSDTGLVLTEKLWSIECRSTRYIRFDHITVLSSKINFSGL